MDKVEFIFTGDSWALKGFTEQNYNTGSLDHTPGDVRLADHWPWRYRGLYRPGCGNLQILQHLLDNDVEPHMPIIWVYTEPGRDYGRITGDSEFRWMESENIFSIRESLNKEILSRIRQSLPNPIGFIGGLADIDVETATSLGFTVLHHSWQKWISEKMQSQWFQFGWGACDIGWRMDYNNITPSRAATFAWDEQIKEWCWWQDHDYFSHEHPTPKANQEFADFLKPTVENWLASI